MSSWRLFVLLSCVLACGAAEEAWRSNCKVLNNRAVSPFLFFSQSDIAVLATYSSVSQIGPAFNRGDKVSFIITPICWIKGFLPVMDLTIESGTQKCQITHLSTLIEYPSLFFLRKQNGTKKWTLLNSGEFQHVVDSTGLLFGVGPAGEKFPQMCGLEHRRLPIDANCEQMECLSYCNFRRAPVDNCFKPNPLLAKHMPKADIPAPVPEFIEGQPTSSESKKAAKGKEGMESKEKSEIAVPTSNKKPKSGASFAGHVSGLILLSVLSVLLTLV